MSDTIHPGASILAVKDSQVLASFPDCNGMLCTTLLKPAEPGAGRHLMQGRRCCT